MMSQSKRQFFSGNTIEQAVLAAACHYHVDPDRIAYRQVEKRHGFVKMRRRVVIEVDPDNLLRPEPEVRPAERAQPQRERPLPPARPPAAETAEERPEDEPPADAPPRPPAADRSPDHRREEPPRRHRPRERREEGAEVADGGRRRAGEASPEELTAGAREAVERILRLAKLDLEATVTPGDDRLEVDLVGPDRDRLLDEEGEVLQAIEYLVPRVMRGIVGDSAACRVDSGNFRRDREDELVGLARRTAEAVRERGQPITLEPMNPTERRTVHVTLADEPGVATESEGEGYFKQVVVFPE